MASRGGMLIWKEWRERRTTLALAIAWIVAGVVYAVAWELQHGLRTPIASFYSTSSLYGMFAAVFLAMRTSLGEATQSTLGFSSSLPLSLRRAAGARLAGAVAVLVLPLMVGAALLSVVMLTGVVEQAAERALSNPYVSLPQRASQSPLQAIGFLWRVTAVTIAQSTQLLLILSVIGARRRAEIHVGFVGAVLVIPWLFLSELHQTVIRESWLAWIGAIVPQSLVVSYGYGNEYASYGDLSLSLVLWGPLAANLLILLGLTLWFCTRYGSRSTGVDTRMSAARWRASSLLSRWSPSLPGRLGALVWLNLRQSTPLTTAGLAVAVLLTAMELLLQFRDLPPIGAVTGQLPGIAWILGTLWATVVGAGVFAGELQPGLSGFWRSRPIAAGTWYWTKYVVGLIVVLAVLDGVTVAVSWNSAYASDPARMSWSYVICIPLLHAMMYSLAVLGVCWWRRPVAGALSAIVAFLLLSLMLETFSATRHLEPLHVYNHLFDAERQSGMLSVAGSAYAVTYSAVALIAAASALGAAWAATCRSTSVARIPQLTGN